MTFFKKRLSNPFLGSDGVNCSKFKKSHRSFLNWIRNLFVKKFILLVAALSKKTRISLG